MRTTAPELCVRWQTCRGDDVESNAAPYRRRGAWPGTETQKHVRSILTARLDAQQTKVVAISDTVVRPFDQSWERRTKDPFTHSRVPASVAACGFGEVSPPRDSLLQAELDFSWLQIHVPFFSPC